MNIKVNESTMVYPADETTPKQSLWLSKLDMMLRQPYSHTRVLFIYPLTHSQSVSPSPTNTNFSTFFDAKILKEALSKALVPFYPLAGRLRVNENTSRYEIDCNEKGALFVEAETKYTLSDLGDDFMPNNNLQKELLPDCDYTKGISSFPLLIIQITRFSCGGVTLGVATHHHVADGFAHMQFTNSWASLARGLELRVLPCHDRAAFLAPRDPPQVTFKHLEYEPPLPPLPQKSGLSGGTNPTTEYLFKLSEEQVNSLKSTAMSVDVAVSYKLSTFKVIAAHVWRSVCKARGLTDDQDVKLYIHTDGRSRLKEPSLPLEYFGNSIFFACSIAKAGDIVHKPLWYTIVKVDEAMRRMDNVDYLRSAIDYLESQADLKDVIRGNHTVASPNLEINSWGRLPISEADFGWGGPKSIGLGEIGCEGKSKIISSLTKDKSLYVGIRLFSSQMDLFRKYFYDF